MKAHCIIWPLTLRLFEHSRTVRSIFRTDRGTMCSQSTDRDEALTVGEEHVTVITFDIVLHEKAVQLVDARADLKGKVLSRRGELHVVMATLKGSGSSTENSERDAGGIEADVYDSATTRQILHCTHYKRSLRAHI